MCGANKQAQAQAQAQGKRARAGIEASSGSSEKSSPSRCNCSSCQVEHFKRENGLLNEVGLTRSCIFSKRLSNEMEAIKRRTSGSGAGQRNAEATVVYSYVNHDIGPSSAHIFGHFVETSRESQMIFDILCIYVPDEMRRRGIGSQMYAMLEADIKASARKTSCNALVMRAEAGTSAFMTDSIKFWQHRNIDFTKSGIGGSNSMEKNIYVCI